MKKLLDRHAVMLILLVLAVILVPFMLFHNYLDAAAESILSTATNHLFLTALLLVALLLSDILLPIPSSIVSVGAGVLLGFFYGALVSFVGMTTGCLLGYFIGKKTIHSLKWINAETKEKMEKFFQRFGKWSIIIARPIPVLAEASVFFAGMSKMNWKEFLLTSTLSNLGISIMYAAIGAYSVSINSMLLAFAAAIILPGLVMFVERKFQATNHKIVTQVPQNKMPT